MMRALWSAASGMINQQTNVDTIANNLANVNTVGYKSEKAEFKSILYQTITTPNDTTKPVGTQIGLGVRTSAISSRYSQGIYQETGQQWDFAIGGDGFFCVTGNNGEDLYTRAGNFSLVAAGDELWLVTQDGYAVKDTAGNPIRFPADMDTGKIAVDQDGNFYAPDEDGNLQQMGIQFEFAQFNNPGGLVKTGGTYVIPSLSSGDARFESQEPQLTRSEVRQQYLEASNVSVVDEMVDMIVAQRAYEMNSKAIQAADEMLGQANQLKR